MRFRFFDDARGFDFGAATYRRDLGPGEEKLSSELSLDRPQFLELPDGSSMTSPRGTHVSFEVVDPATNRLDKNLDIGASASIQVRGRVRTHCQSMVHARGQYERWVSIS